MSRTIYDEKSKLWSGLKQPKLQNSDISISQRLLDVIFSHGSKVAQVISKYCFVINIELIKLLI